MCVCVCVCVCVSVCLICNRARESVSVCVWYVCVCVCVCVRVCWLCNCYVYNIKDTGLILTMSQNMHSSVVTNVISTKVIQSKGKIHPALLLAKPRAVRANDYKHFIEEDQPVSVTLRQCALITSLEE